MVDAAILAAAQRRARFRSLALVGLVGLSLVMLVLAAVMRLAGAGHAEPIGLMAVDRAVAAQATVQLSPQLLHSTRPAGDSADPLHLPHRNAASSATADPRQAQPHVQILEEIVHAPQADADITRDDVPMFDGRPLRKARTLRMLVTAYSPDERSCGIWADGITASGMSVYTNGMKLVAADTRLLPFRSIVSIPGYNDGKPVPVLDRGGAIKGHRLDVLYPTHERALKWGVQRLDVTVWEYAD